MLLVVEVKGRQDGLKSTEDVTVSGHVSGQNTPARTAEEEESGQE